MGHPELREHWSQVCGWKVFARISDEPALEPRPGIVLVHGLAVSTRYMMPLARELAPAWKVYAPDLPGYGRSESPRRSLSIQALAEVLHLWISSMRLRETILIGNSMGCQIAVEYMLRCRHRVQACVMLGPTMDAYARNTPAQIWRLLRDQFHEPPSLVPLQAFDYLRFGPIRTLTTFYTALGHDMLGRSAQVKVPTLVMRGAKDAIVSQRWAETVAHSMPGGELVVVSGAGHALNYNSPKAVGNEVERFWARVSQRNLRYA